MVLVWNWETICSSFIGTNCHQFSGGLSKISVDRVDTRGRSMSPIMPGAELFNCPGNKNTTVKLPDYPLGKIWNDFLKQ